MLSQNSIKWFFDQINLRDDHPPQSSLKGGRPLIRQKDVLNFVPFRQLTDGMILLNLLIVTFPKNQHIDMSHKQTRMKLRQRKMRARVD